MSEAVKRLVVFAILMETGDGIADKSPDYILEKFDAATHVPFPDELLDSNNKIKLQRWLKTWLTKT
jgi:hypothetical protein